MAEKNFDGIVWDTPFNYFERSRVSLNSLIVDFIKAIRERLPREKLIFFNMANPLGHMQSLDLDNYNQLPINYLLIQNYDKRTNYLTMIQKSI
jgi:tRNA G10  N-methylase Trm11